MQQSEGAIRDQRKDAVILSEAGSALSISRHGALMSNLNDRIGQIHCEATRAWSSGVQSWTQISTFWRSTPCM
jgi:hypothetical protein